MRKSLSWLILVVCAAAVWSAGSAGANPTQSGIVGRVVAGPTCPVERVPPDPGCAPRPLAARLRITRVGSRGWWRTVQSAPDGHFRIALAPGRYTVTPLARPGSAFPRPGRPQTVTVRTGQYTRITVTYDTGIR